MARVSQLTVYPVKGCRGISLQQAQIGRTGIVYDRNWMIVDERNGKFCSQRNIPKLALINTTLPMELFTGEWGAPPPDAALHLTAPDQLPLEVPLDQSLLGTPQSRECTCWDWTGPAWDQGDEAARWLTNYIGRSVRLMRYAGNPSDSNPMDEPERRQVPQVNSRFAPGTEIAFADFFPILLTSEGGLAALNAELEQPVPMNRFRPNIVMDDPQPFPEDTWETFRIDSSDGGSLHFGSAYPCARCKVTTTNQATAEVGKEPLRTLKQIRSGKALDWTQEKAWKAQAFFGWLCVPLGEKIVAVGDTLHPMDHRDLSTLAATAA
ncbi:hypothetical protein WJX84_002475 [Apatococcus fuscideae]|uniref:MOSC domain-containing protein n=1 Tax=Apatococcus fuscideae TaxID=2026836 RepID=A0AAW1SWC1_9CHLO